MPFCRPSHGVAKTRKSPVSIGVLAVMTYCIGLHQIAPNFGTNRHQNRHQSYAHFSQSHPSDFRSNGGDFETGTDTRPQRILALQPKQNRHQDFAKPLLNQSETDMQPAPPLLRDVYPTYGAVKRPSAVLENGIVRPVWVVQFTVRFWSPISTRRIGSRSSRLQRSSRRSCGFRTRAALRTSWAP